MRADQIQGLMEAYSQVYAISELLREGPYDAANVRRPNRHNKEEMHLRT
jgi:hypothetical protein